MATTQNNLSANRSDGGSIKNLRLMMKTQIHREKLAWLGVYGPSLDDESSVKKNNGNFMGLMYRPIFFYLKWWMILLLMTSLSCNSLLMVR